MYLHGLRRRIPFTRRTTATCECMGTQVKVRVCGHRLLLLKLKGGFVCDDSATEGGMRRYISASNLLALFTLKFESII